MEIEDTGEDDETDPFFGHVMHIINLETLSMPCRILN